MSFSLAVFVGYALLLLIAFAAAAKDPGNGRAKIRITDPRPRVTQKFEHARATDLEAMDCGVRALALEYATKLLHNDSIRARQVADALRLDSLCGTDYTAVNPQFYGPDLSKPPTLLGPRGQAHKAAVARRAAEQLRLLQPGSCKFVVDPQDGSDTQVPHGRHISQAVLHPYRTLHAAVAAALSTSRGCSASEAPTILLRGGFYYLEQTLYLNPGSNNLTIASYPGEEAVLSGGTQLSDLQWREHKGNSAIKVARLPDDMPLFNSLYVEGKRAIRARFPDCDPETCGTHTRPTGWVAEAVDWLPPADTTPAVEVRLETPTRPDHLFEVYRQGLGGPAALWEPATSYWASTETQGGGAHVATVPTGLTYDPDTFSPRVTNWSNPSTAVVHAFHGGYWGSWAFHVVGRQDETLHFGSGGFQEARGWDSGGQWYVENVLEELDQPGEWFLDTDTRTLYYYPNHTIPLDRLRLVGGHLDVLVAVVGSQVRPVVGVTLQDLVFTETSTTFMQPHEVPSGGDWSIHRGGAVLIEGAVATTVSGCLFSSLGGQGLTVSAYARATHISGNEFSWIGDSAIVLLGRTALADASAGNLPRGTHIENNMIHELGVFTKQSSAIFQSLAFETWIQGNVMFNGPRAGINFNDGLGGSNRVEGNLMFNWNRETFDHGAINSWDRLPYLYNAAPDGQLPQVTLVPGVSLISHNFLIASYHSTWPSDHDDGSSYYEDSFNFNIYGGWKEFLGHSNSGLHNVYVFPDVGQYQRRDLPTTDIPKTGWNDIPFCVHRPTRFLWRGRVGWGDKWNGNTCIMHRSDSLYDLWECDITREMRGLLPEMVGNKLYTPGEPYVKCGDLNVTLAEWQGLGWDLGSVHETTSSLSVGDVLALGRQLLSL